MAWLPKVGADGLRVAVFQTPDDQGVAVGTERLRSDLDDELQKFGLGQGARVPGMNEAWIFLSIGYAGGDRRWVRLEEVIETADGLNHLIPFADEVEAAVSSLIAAGLVEARGLETRLTPTGIAAFAKAIERDVGYVQHLIDLDEAWSARGYPDQGDASWTLDEGTWREALETYHRSMEARHPELRAPIDDD